MAKSSLTEPRSKRSWAAHAERAGRAGSAGEARVCPKEPRPSLVAYAGWPPGCLGLLLLGCLCAWLGGVGAGCSATLWKPRKNGSATMVSMTSNKTSLEAAAVDTGTTKRAEAGRTVMDGVTRSCDLGPGQLATAPGRREEVRGRNILSLTQTERFSLNALVSRPAGEGNINTV